MRVEQRRVVLISAVLVLLGVGTSCDRSQRDAGPDNDYVALDDRDIAALSEADVAALLDGEGAGYALAAELNQYPGPKHVLGLAAGLRLEPDQIEATRRVRARMREAAIALGQRLVFLERELDDVFARGIAKLSMVEDLTRQIGIVEAELRSVHLEAHIAMKALMTPHQIVMYDRLRGYDAGEATVHEHDESHRGSPALEKKSEHR